MKREMASVAAWSRFAVGHIHSPLLRIKVLARCERG